MMWYGQVNFTQKLENVADPATLTRSALLMNLAMKFFGTSKKIKEA